MLVLKTVHEQGQRVWAYNGVFEFNTPDLKELEWGDLVEEQLSPNATHSHPRTQYVNACTTCGAKFLHSTLIFVPFDCADCTDRFSRGVKPYTFDEVYEVMVERYPNVDPELLARFTHTLMPAMNKGKI